VCLDVCTDVCVYVYVYVHVYICGWCGWYVCLVDICVLCIACVCVRVCVCVCGVVRRTALILLQSTPNAVLLESVKSHLLDVENVQGIHELHVWQVRAFFFVCTFGFYVADGGGTCALVDGRKICVISTCILPRHR